MADYSLFEVNILRLYDKSDGCLHFKCVPHTGYAPLEDTREGVGSEPMNHGEAVDVCPRTPVGNYSAGYLQGRIVFKVAAEADNILKTLFHKGWDVRDSRVPLPEAHPENAESACLDVSQYLLRNGSSVKMERGRLRMASPTAPKVKSPFSALPGEGDFVCKWACYFCLSVLIVQLQKSRN